MAEEWIMVRLKRSTRERLAEEAMKMTEAYHRGQRCLINDPADGISVDDLVRAMLLHYTDHKERAREQGRRRRKGRVKPSNDLGAGV